MSQEQIGPRLRSLRLQRGLSQAQLAGADLSPSYVSLLEAGKRSATPVVVELLARRLGCDPELLAHGVARADAAELELDARYAELALRSGEASEAVSRFRALLDRDAEPTPPLLRAQAAWGLARSVKATGDVEGSIALYERIREEAEAAPDKAAWVPAVMALCGCYLEVGDLARSVELGELARSRLTELGLGSTGGRQGPVQSLVKMSTTVENCAPCVEA